MEIRNESTGPVHVDLHDRNGPAKHIRLMPGSTIVHESVGRSGPSVIAMLDEGPKKLNFGPLTSPGRAYLEREVHVVIDSGGALRLRGAEDAPARESDPPVRTPAGE